MAERRLDFEIDEALEASLVTPRAGVPSLIEAFRQTGAAARIDEGVRIKTRQRGLSASRMVESLLALWAAGGERCEDLDRLRQDAALASLLGYPLPAAQTARDFLAAFHEDDLPLLHAGKSTIPCESAPLVGLAAANRELIVDLQSRKPVRTATLDVDATVIASTKRAAKSVYEGGRGYQPVLALWAEQDVIVADEFRDGNVPAGVGNARVIETAVAALPGTFDHIYVRGDSALYAHEAMAWMDKRAIGYAISADMTGPLKAAILALPQEAWRFERADGAVVREWAEVDFVPDDGVYKKDWVAPRRYLAVRLRPAQGDLLGSGETVKHFCVVTNRADPEGGSGLDLIRWHRGKAGTIEHAHDVLMNELAGWALPSQKFGANAAWLRLNALLYNLLSAYKRVGLPEELRDARPKRLRFLFINAVGKVVRHARETLLRFADALARTCADAPRAFFGAPRPSLTGV
ncbi:MAG TPA: IS1380 family transposase [Methylocystis sp.]|nr:IS1380 family transposase [Methylocystis sp.]